MADEFDFGPSGWQLDPDEKFELLEKFVQQIAEHFDNVQVFASSLDNEGSTHSFHSGKGNWHARLGQVKTFVNSCDENYRLEEGKRYRKKEEEKEEENKYGGDYTKE